MTAEKRMRIAFAGGGTGGHLYPALAVADRLSSRNPGLEVLFIGTKYGIESRVVPEAGYRFRKIISRGARGKGMAGQVMTMAYLAVGIVQSTVTLGRFKPDIVFGSGGYASAAAIIAAFLLRRKIVIQEQNSIPGLVNRQLASLAARIYLGFEKAAGYLAGHPGVRVTGNPLRGKIASRGAEEASPGGEFGLDSGKPVLLVFGGSQGARTLNRAAAEYILSRADLQAIVQTGKRDFEEISAKLSSAAGRVFVSEYI
ncbi:MAG TPA: UDP-N-acetylglucosamine--N-acetylmuramyl-(pentapeptide) pyrophosphoryl-undecaprenol N-acetylglucosamine transferase, partial [Candidatus Krumholzibacterium sp.]|nr:UDP-N-acetylglucosamine--N-acetylmuramyl-(pentapeptide) pyrophosphoryl-undecaprenol N-acetylglucosamine transferase [Candidatus Krumholzibacterium sp.]